MSNIQDILKDMRAAMDKDIAHVKHEFTSVRSGKASPSMLDSVKVEAYGQMMALNQVATINAPEPRVIIVTPFDKSQIKIVEKAIRDSGLGLEPSANGPLIRVPLPSMNEQRRKELVKLVHKYAEDGKVAIRHARTQARDGFKKLAGVSEDDVKHGEKDVQKLHDDYIKKIDDLIKAKEAEIMEVVSSELTKRVAVGVIGAPIAIAIVMYGDWALAALLAVASALAAWELFRIAERTGLMPMDQIGVALAGLIPLVVDAAHLGLYPPDAAVGPVSLVTIALLALLALAIWTRGVQGKPLGAVAVTAFGAAYTGGMLSYAFSIRYHEYAFAPAALGLGGGHTFALPSGGLLLLLPVLLTWASDIGAYAVGRTMGRHKLIPSVSPGKTIEGSVGGLLASMLVAWLYMRYVLHPASHLDFRWAPVGVLAFGAVVSVAAQIGDLVESLLKREAGVKDSSHIIPGHGGVLDRLDSLLFVLPVAYVLITPMLTWAPT